MKVLITGGAGYIGSILVPTLLSNGHKVTVLDNYLYRQNTLLDFCWRPDFDIVRGDVRDWQLVLDLVNKHDAIIPLAAIVGMPACKRDPVLAEQVNYEAVKFIAQQKADAQLLIYPNTNSGYGQGEGAEFTEESELKPISVYGVTKVQAEEVVRSVPNSVVFRLATVFGVSPKMRLDLLVNDFTYRAWNDGFISLFEPHFKRNYVHVRDVADLFAWTLDSPEGIMGEVFNFGLSNANLTKRELCEKIKEQIPEFHINEVDFRKDPDQRNYIVLNDKIEERGFWADRTVEAGITELIKSFNILQPNIYSNLL